MVAVDGAGARSHWVTMEAPSAPAPRVSGRAAVVGDRLALATEQGDGRGAVHVLGEWTHPLDAAARGGVASDGTRVYATNLAARLVALDATTGALQWAHDLGDPSVRWNLGVPVVRGGRVYAGSAMSVHAFAADDGTPIWATELAPEDWAASWAGLTADDDTVVIAATNDHLDLAALDAHDGSVRWRHGSRDIAGVSTTPAIVGAYAVAARAPGWLTAYRLTDGTTAWEVPLDDAWPVALAISAPLAFVRSATGRVTAHQVDDGAVVWECELGPGERAGRPYSRHPGGARVPLVVIGDRVWTATFDAMIALDRVTGAVVHREAAGTEVATVVALDGRAAAVTVDALGGAGLGGVISSSSATGRPQEPTRTRAGVVAVEPRGRAGHDGGSESGRRPGEAPRAVGHVVATLLPLELDLVEGEHGEVGDGAGRDDAAVGQAEELGRAAGEQVDGFFDLEESGVAHVVRVQVEVLARAREQLEVRTAVVDVGERARLAECGDHVVLGEALGRADHDRPDAVGEHPLGERVGDVQTALLGVVGERQVERSRTGLGDGEDHLVGAVDARRGGVRAVVPVVAGPVTPRRDRRATAAWRRRGR